MCHTLFEVKLEIPYHINKTMKATKSSDFHNKGSQHLGTCFEAKYPIIAKEIWDIVIAPGSIDSLVWTLSNSRTISVRDDNEHFG